MLRAITPLVFIILSGLIVAYLAGASDVKSSASTAAFERKLFGGKAPKILNRAASKSNVATASNATSSDSETAAEQSYFSLIPDTDYSYPANAIFVAPTGADTNSGSQQQPVSTITQAIALAPSGGTIVMRAGVYRDGMSAGINKSVTLQPYPHEKVWLDGTDQVQRWTAASPTSWYTSNWAPPLCSANCVVGADLIDPAYPLAGSPQMVFYDDKPLVEVGSISAVTASSFYYDAAARRLYIGANPAGHEVDAAAQPKAFQLIAGAAGSTIRGIGVRRYGSNQNYNSTGAMVIANANNLTFENDVFYESASTGILLATNTQNTIIRGSLFLDNGFDGIVSNQNIHTTLTGNTFDTNNNEHFATETQCTASCAAAGVKFSRASDPVLTDNVFKNNIGKGFWCDLGCTNLTFVRNTSYNNIVGVHYEVSSGGIIASNVLYDNSKYGFESSGTDSFKFYNNSLVNNGINLGIYDDSRSPSSDSYSSAKGLTWNASNISVVNNLLYGGGSWNGLGMPDELDTNAQQTNASNFFATLDSNSYYRATASSPTTLIRWCPASGHCVSYTNLASFKSAVGDEINGQEFVQSSDPFFMNVGSGDYRVVGSSSARLSGAVLPADVAAAIGVAGGLPVDRGALLWVGRPAN